VSIEGVQDARGKKVKAGNLERLREAAEFTQVDLAKLCDTTQKTISAIETGVQGPRVPIALLKKLSKHLKCSIDELVK
jgi:DNA-binding XRE family transcriptional regulator